MTFRLLKSKIFKSQQKRTPHPIEDSYSYSGLYSQIYHVDIYLNTSWSEHYNRNLYQAYAVCTKRNISAHSGAHKDFNMEDAILKSLGGLYIKSNYESPIQPKLNLTIIVFLGACLIASLLSNLA